MNNLLRILANLLRLWLLPLWLYARWSWSRGEPRWVSVSIKPRLTQFPPRDTLLRRLTARAREQLTTSLPGLRALVETIEKDAHVRGLLVRLPPIEAGWTGCESLRELFARLRAAGKQVICYLPEGGRNRELYVALAADRVFMAPYTSLGPLGLALQPVYIRPLLDRLGVRVEAHATGEYKSAAEPALRDGMSEPAREQLTALLSARHRALVSALEGRGLTSTQVDEVFSRALLLADEALELGVIDAVLYEDELAAQLRELTAPAANSDEPAPQPLAAAAYMKRKAPLWKALKRRDCIAVVPLHGTISGEQPGGIGAGLRHSTLAPVLRSLASDAHVHAVVLHIDSPGGSALASELMHHDIQTLAKKKPVVACFGEVAASGGYYIACACNKIVAHDLCITGSIGVVAASVNAAGLFEHMGLRPQSVRTTASADMLSVTRSLTPQESTQLDAHVAELYRRFLEVAAQSRSRSSQEIHEVARGRVWTGSEAHQRGLVDVLGGVDRALDEARALVTGVPAAKREALQPRVYRLKSSTGLGLSAARALLLAPWWPELEELATLETLRREHASYYASLPRVD